jgi:hypothetical protein
MLRHKKSVDERQVKGFYAITLNEGGYGGYQF